MFKNLTVNDVVKYVREIPNGTFSYNKFRKENPQLKTISRLDVGFEYIAQLPYLRIVTGPIALVTYMTGFIAFVGYVYVSDLVFDLRNKKDA